MELRAFRELNGLSQTDVAVALALGSKSSVSQIESGAMTMPIRLALKIELWSGGKVRAIELLPQADAELLQAVIDLARRPAEEVAA